MTTAVGVDTIKAAVLLSQNELVAIPTETVYGLAANAMSDDAVLKIYETKQRPRFNPLILHFANADSAFHYGQSVSPSMQLLARHFWPGSLTLLVPKNSLVNDLVTAGSNRVALRVPSHPLTLQLLQRIDFPLAAPSANRSGYVSPTTAQHVLMQLNGEIPYVLDGGECAVGLESTIAGENEDGKLTIYRTGAVTPEMIHTVTGIMPELQLTSHASESPDTPGQLISHYATHTPLYLYHDFDNIKHNLPAYSFLDIAFAPREPLPGYAAHWILAKDGDAVTAAKNLFRYLRQADDGKFSAIIVELAPPEGIGLAINDRLRRAQHYLKNS